MACDRDMTTKQINTVFRRWYHTTWRMRFLFRVFPVKMPAAQIVWDYCQRQFISGLSGKMLEVASDGALVLKHFDADPFGLEASVLSRSIGQQASQPAPDPAPPAASVVPILGTAPVASGDFLAGGIVAFD